MHATCDADAPCVHDARACARMPRSNARRASEAADDELLPALLPAPPGSAWERLGAPASGWERLAALAILHRVSPSLLLNRQWAPRASA